MPELKSAKTLFQICLAYVTNHMDEWAKKSPELDGTEDIEFIEKSTNPFHEIPSIIMDEIIALLKANSLLEAKIIGLLITPQLRTLDFSSMCKENKVSGLLRLATIKSPDLKNLWLAHSTHFLDNDDYVSFIPKFSNLEVLDISYSKKGDSCLHLLGKHSKNLRVLHAKYSSVSDDGIQDLCVTGQCKSIHTLDLFQSCVTSHGLQLAIQNLPSLTSIEHLLILDVLADVAKVVADKKLANPQLSLSTLAVRTPHYRIGSLALALSLCSSIIALDIKIPKELTDNELQALLSLTNLSVLRLHAENHITFDGGILPLLKAFGKSLKTLELSFLTVVNIRAIIEYCPNLNSLSLCCNYSMTWPEEERNPCEEKRVKMEKPELKNLEELNILHGDSCVKLEKISALISFSSLKSILLQGCCVLTDDILLKVANCHLFKNLESFKIFGCQSVSKKGIDVLMKEGNSLKELEVRSCGRVMLRHVASWVRKAYLKNWDLSIYPEVPFHHHFVESYDSDDNEEPSRMFDYYWIGDFLLEFDSGDESEEMEEEESDDDESDDDESDEDEDDVLDF